LVAHLALGRAQRLDEAKRIMTATRTHEILVFIDWYLPGYKAGGPIQSLANLVSQLPHRFSIVTSIYDHHSSEPYHGITPNKWVTRNPNERVIYLDHAPKLALLKQLLNEQHFDFVYLNSLFSVNFTIRPLLYLKRIGYRGEIILAPRGMLKQGALSVKPLKKKLFLRIGKSLKLFRRVRWAASTSDEQGEIARHFGQHSRVHIAPNLAKQAKKRNDPPTKSPGAIKLYTVARVSAEKNILGGVHYLAGLVDGQVEWHVYGTLQDPAYVVSCRQAALSNPSLSLVFHGEIQPAEVPSIALDKHFFFLPTLGENYGHATVEALAMGIPVIISDRTPWRNLAADMAGFDVPLNKERFHDTLLFALTLDHASYLRWCEGAFERGKAIVDDPDALNANLELFKLADE
jgi:glycosyltransferase involved in cell wall biosynthesis